MLAVDSKAMIQQFVERAFNEGDLAAVDEHLAPDYVDHQEPVGTNFPAHLKQVIYGMRYAFPDLHFEIHDMLSEGEIVAFRSTMTGTHLGTANFGAGPIPDRKSTRLNSSHSSISYAVFCLKKKTTI